MTVLGAVAEIVDCEHKTAPTSEIGEYFAVGTPAMRGNSITYSEARRIDAKTFDDWTRRMRPKAGDLLFAREAPVGPIVRIPPEENVAPGQRTVLIRLHVDSVDSRYVFYLIASPRIQSDIQLLSAGSTVAHLNVSDVRELDLGELPSLSAQRAIVEVLGALDDKIAANRRILTVADGLVRVKYDSLPRGCARLGDIADEVRQKVEPIDIQSDCVCVGLEHLRRRSMWLQATGRGSDVSSTKSVFVDRDVLFGKLRPYFHKVSSASGNGVCSTDILVVRAKESQDASLVLAACASDEVVAAAVQNSNGTRMPRAKWADIAECSVPDPGSAEAAAFVDFADAVRLRCLAAIRENDVLATVRDELLPLLMDGRITVKEAEKRVEDVV